MVANDLIEVRDEVVRLSRLLRLLFAITVAALLVLGFLMWAGLRSSRESAEILATVEAIQQWQVYDAVLPQGSRIELFQDLFEDGEGVPKATHWENVGNEITVEDGEVVIPCRSVQGTPQDMESELTYDIQASEVVYEVETVPTQGEATLEVIGPQPSRYILGFRVTDGELQAYTVDRRDFEPGESVGLEPNYAEPWRDDIGFLRLRVSADGNQVFLDTSSDGVVWDDFYTQPVEQSVDWSGVRIEMSCEGSPDEALVVDAVNPGAVAPPPAP